MAQLKDLIVTGDSRFVGNVYNNSAMIAYGTCATAAATAAKEIVINDPSWTLKVGNIIAVKFTNTNSASNCTFNVNGTGAKQVWYNTGVQTGTSSSYFGYANRTALYIYDGTYWVLFYYGYDANDNSYDRTMLNYERRYAGTAIPPYHLVMVDVDGRLQPITPTSGTGTSHVANTVAVRPDRIYYVNASGTYAAGAVVGDNTLYEAMPVSSNYNFNASIPAYRACYLKGKYNSTTGLFTLDNTNTTSYYVYTPTNTASINLTDYFVNGYNYIYVGASDETANHLQLATEHTMYYFDGTNLVPTIGKTIWNGTSAPTATIGADGDIYVQYTA